MRLTLPHHVRKEPPCLHLDLGLPVSKTMRKYREQFMVAMGEGEKGEDLKKYKLVATT